MSKWDIWLVDYSYLHPCQARDRYYELIKDNYKIHYSVGTLMKACTTWYGRKGK